MPDDLLADTPCVVIDMARVERNIARFQALADAAGKTARPHVKTHKIPALAKMQIAAGAKGITCQKIGEAEVMADAGIDDILITYPIVGPAKLGRLRALAGRCRVSTIADSAEVVDGLAAAFAGAPEPLAVLVEIDAGQRRCGVATPEAALALAERIAASPGLRFDGLMTYAPARDEAEMDSLLGTFLQRINGAGLDVRRVSVGGSPRMARLGEVSHATEHRAGSYIFGDRALVASGTMGLDECALTVRATVVSRPASDRAVIDAGSKVLTTDLSGQDGFGLILGHPEARIDRVNEEHGMVELAGDWQPKVGEIVEIVPNHCCVVENMLDEVLMRHPDGRVETVAVAARGRVR